MTENTIKDTYWGYLMRRFRKHGYSIKYPEEKASNQKEGENPPPTMPPGVRHEHGVLCCLFQSEAADSYGSAKEIADDFVNFKTLSMNHVIELIGTRTGK